MPHGDVQGREAELARERAAARGLDVDDAVRDVLVVVEIVRQRQVGEFGQRGGNDLRGGAFAGEQLTAEAGEGQVRLAGDDVVGQLRDGLGLGFVADLRPAEDDREVRAEAFEGGDKLGCGRDVPDVNAEADDLRVPRQERFGDVDGSLVDIEFDNGGGVAQRAEVGEQVAQPEGGVDILRVERRQDDISHRAAQVSSVAGDCSTLFLTTDFRISRIRSLASVSSCNPW